MKVIYTIWINDVSSLFSGKLEKMVRDSDLVIEVTHATTESSQTGSGRIRFWRRRYFLIHPLIKIALYWLQITGS